MAHDDQFTATGPSLVGSGFPRAGFSTKAVDMEHGANVVGKTCGVYGESVTGESSREPDFSGVGVNGRGEMFGVVGEGPGIASVYGHGKRSKVGVLGGVIREGAIGVVGASMISVGPDQFQTMPVKGTGHGTGVYGTSKTGTGVHGTSSEGDGVLGESDAAAGVHGKSNSGVGVTGESDGSAGVFGKSNSGVGVTGESDGSAGVFGKSTGGVGVVGVSNGGNGGVFVSDKFAQINLGPLFQLPQLPCEGRAGDLLVVSPLKQDEEDQSPQGVASLWFCTKSQTQEGGPAIWARVAFNGIATCDIGFVPTPPRDLPFLKE